LVITVRTAGTEAYRKDSVVTGSDFSRDPINNAIYGKQGIKRAIDIVFEGGCLGAGLILIFAAIDAMGNLARPDGKDQNDGDDFKQWVSRYLRLSGDIDVTPDDLWGARNAVLHTYGAYSRDVLSGKAKVIGWVDRCRPPVRYAPGVDPDMLMVSVSAFKDAFSAGVDKFLTDVFSDPDLKCRVEPRLPELLMALPFPK
jgi:hypothetical protein